MRLDPTGAVETKGLSTFDTILPDIASTRDIGSSLLPFKDVYAVDFKTSVHPSFNTDITNLETKTQNQSATLGNTNFLGTTTFDAGFLDQKIKFSFNTALNNMESLINNTSPAPLILTASYLQTSSVRVNDLITNNNATCQGIGTVQIINDGTCTINPSGLLTLKGCKLTGEIDMDGFKIVDVSDPTQPTDAANKEYVDASFIESFKWGSFMITFNATPALVSNSGYMLTTGLSNLGGSLALITQSTLSTLAKIFRVASNVSSTANGARSGYIATATFPTLYPRIGFNYNVAFGIGDSNSTITAVTQLLFGFTTTTVAPTWNSTTGPNTTPSIMGIGHDVGDTYLHWYSRGTTTGSKIATPFLASTRSTYWLNLNIYNPTESLNVFLTLKDEISGLTSTQTFTFSAGSPTGSILQSSRIYPIHMSAMGVAGGITGSAVPHFGRFQLSLK